VLAAPFPGLHLEVLATDVDPAMLRRAHEATYDASSFRELPAGWRERGFTRRGERYVLRAEHRRLVSVRQHDLRNPPPAERFDLILCRNVAFTYLAAVGQNTVLARLTGALRPGGALVIGLHESLPEPAPGLARWPGARAVLRPARKPRHHRAGRQFAGRPTDHTVEAHLTGVGSDRLAAPCCSSAEVEERDFALDARRSGLALDGPRGALGVDLAHHVERFAEQRRDVLPALLVELEPHPADLRTGVVEAAAGARITGVDEDVA